MTATPGLLTLAAWLAGAGTAPEAPLPPPPPHPRAIAVTDLTWQLPDPAALELELAGGATVFLDRDDSLPLFEIAAAVRGGSFLDGELPGLARLAGALQRRGGAATLEPATLDERLADLAVEIDTFGGRERSGAALDAPSWNARQALELFLDVLFAPRFDERRLEVVRAELMEEMRRRGQDPLAVLEREWNRLVFGTDSAQASLPTPASAAAIDRERIAALHRRLWRPERLVLAISGRFDPAVLAPVLAERLAAASVTGAPPVPWPPPRSSHRARPGLYLYDIDRPQAKVLLGHTVADLPWTSRDRLALEVLAEIVGGRGAISRIHGRLRAAESLVYRTEVTLAAGAVEPGIFAVFFDTESGNLARALTATRQEIARLRRQPVTTAELDTVRQTLLGRLRLAFDTAEGRAGTLAEDRLLGRPHEYWHALRETVESISAGELADVARRYLEPERLVYVIVARAAEVAPPGPPGTAAVERAAGHPLTRLPRRDPLTLEVLARRP